MTKENSRLNKLAWIVTVFLFSSITVFESYTWGKYVLFAECFLIFIIDVILQKGKYKIYINSYHKFLCGMILFSGMSVLWGINKSDCLAKTFTYIQILICTAIVYNYYKKGNVNKLVSAVKWSGYIISIYSIWFYGLDFIIKMIFSGVRIENSYSNVNAIGMISAIAIVIQFEEIVRNHKISMSTLFCVPTFIMVIATQSRKAIIVLVIGVIMIMLFRNMQNKKIIEKYIKIIIVFILMFLGIKYLFSLEMFQGIAKRMAYIVAMFSGKGDVGTSILLRQRLIELGKEIFRQNPIVGIGMGCPHVIVDQRLNFDAYLHNGFVEILAAGGIVGFVIYYSAYVYLLWNLYKFRKYKNEAYILCVTLTIIFLFRDYAMVSLYSKSMYFYLMILFLEIESLKRKKYGGKENEIYKNI